MVSGGKPGQTGGLLTGTSGRVPQHMTNLQVWMIAYLRTAVNQLDTYVQP